MRFDTTAAGRGWVGTRDVIKGQTHDVGRHSMQLLAFSSVLFDRALRCPMLSRGVRRVACYNRYTPLGRVLCWGALQPS